MREHFCHRAFAAERRQALELHGGLHETRAGFSAHELGDEEDDEERGDGAEGDARAEFIEAQAERAQSRCDEPQNRAHDPRHGRAPDEALDVREVEAAVAFADHAAGDREHMIRAEPEAVALEGGAAAAGQFAIGFT